MRDEMDARIWNEHHEGFSDSLHAAFAKIGTAFEALHRYQWAAPWRRDEKRPFKGFDVPQA